MSSSAAEIRPLTYRSNVAAPMDVPAYEAHEGYAAVRKALTGMAPGEITELVKASGLSGRGGAGFPTGTKWSLVPTGPDAPTPRYVICNADEMEPGTYKDRMLMEGVPHQLIEGMILAGYAIGAHQGYIFLRGEYVLAAERLKTAIAQARAAGLLGERILGSAWSFELSLHEGAGRYMCGEETALLSSLEGRRANPRSKPPFPQTAGLWNRPTIVNNVETLSNVPHIVLRGAKWFRGLAAPMSKSTGTKLYGVAGRVRRPGLWELPFGTHAREILEEHAGGMQEGMSLKCWLPGGISTEFLLPEHLDLPMDFAAIAAAGSRLGTGLITVVEGGRNLLPLLRNIEDFFARESCGWCTPCRDGLPWTVRILAALERGEGAPGDIETLEQLTRHMAPGRTFCAHAPGAMEPLQSALKLFRGEFEAGIAAVPQAADRHGAQHAA